MNTSIQNASRYLLVADLEDGAELYFCRDEAHVEQQLAAVLFGPTPTASDRIAAKACAAELLKEGIANTDGAFDVVLHALSAPQAAAGNEPPSGAHPPPTLRLEAGTAIRRWIREHKLELNDVEFGRIDASLDRLMMHLALGEAARVAAARAAEPVYRFLQPGDIIHATDECISDNFRSWDPVDPEYAGRLSGDESATRVPGSIFRGMPYTVGMKPIRRIVAGSSDAEGTGA
jgi:hypothetical protein